MSISFRERKPRSGWSAPWVWLLRHTTFWDCGQVNYEPRNAGGEQGGKLCWDIGKVRWWKEGRIVGNRKPKPKWHVGVLELKKKVDRSNHAFWRHLLFSTEVRTIKCCTGRRINKRLRPGLLDSECFTVQTMSCPFDTHLLDFSVSDVWLRQSL